MQIIHMGPLGGSLHPEEILAQCKPFVSYDCSHVRAHSLWVLIQSHLLILCVFPELTLPRHLQTLPSMCALF